MHHPKKVTQTSIRRWLSALPVGEKAQFHMDKDHMRLRVEDLDGKERDYIVVSMTPRTEAALESRK